MRVIKPAGDERHNYQVSILWHNKKVTCDGATRRAARIREVCPRHRGRFSAARRGGGEVYPHRGGWEVSTKIVMFFRTALPGAVVARVRLLSLGPRVYAGRAAPCGKTSLS